MSEFKKILCATDFSEYSEYAMRYATAFAKISAGTIDCVHVVDTGFVKDGSMDGVYVSGADLQRSLDAIKATAEKELEHFIRKEHFLGVDMTPHLREGHAANEIVKLADEIGADLLIIATHGRSGLERLVFGGTCDKVLRLSKTPVLAIKHPEHEALEEDGSLKINRILCPLDFSEFSRSGLGLAADLARQFNSTIVLAHVVDARFDYPEWTAQVAMNTSEQLAKSAEENLKSVAEGMEGLETEIVVTKGIPHRILIEKTKENDIDLVIIATHGRKGLAHALLGSVTEKVVRSAGCPVLTIRPSE